MQFPIMSVHTSLTNLSPVDCTSSTGHRAVRVISPWALIWRWWGAAAVQQSESNLSNCNTSATVARFWNRSRCPLWYGVIGQECEGGYWVVRLAGRAVESAVAIGAQLSRQSILHISLSAWRRNGAHFIERDCTAGSGHGQPAAAATAAVSRWYYIVEG